MTDTGKAVEQDVAREEFPPLDDMPLADAPPPRPGRPRPFRLKPPATAHVVGVLLMIFAVFGILALIGLMILLTNAQIKALGLLTLIGSLITIAIISSAVNAAMSVGLLRMASWARKGTIISQLALLAFGSVVSGFVLFNEVPFLHHAVPGLSSEFSPGVMAFLAMLIYAFAVFTNLLVTANIIFFLTRAESVEAFNRLAARG